MFQHILCTFIYHFKHTAIKGEGAVVNAQNYVFDFESVIAKVFLFRPTCSSYDSERKIKSKSEPKRTRKEREQMWQTWINSMDGL